MAIQKTLKNVSAAQFKSRWPRLYKKIMEMYAPVFDRFVAIDLWLQGKPAPTCEMCGVRLQVSKKNPTRCPTHSKVTNAYTYPEFLDLVPAVNKNHTYKKWNGIKSAAKSVEVTCEEHGTYHVEMKAVLDGRQCQGCYHKNRDKRQVTVTEWALRSATAHNNFYQYDLTTFKSLNEYVTVICPVHGSFQQVAGVHMYGHGCTQCAADKNKEQRSDTTEIFIEKANKVHNNKYTYEKTVYTGCRNHVTITCPDHGDFDQVAYYHTFGHGCKACGAETTTYQSSEEFEIVDFLKSHNINVKHGWFFKQRQYDIYLPDHRIAIEHDGLFWHTSRTTETDNYYSTYHVERTDMCEESGIQLFHITDLEWHDTIKQNIWKSVILSKCKLSPSTVYARKCQVRSVPSKESREFFDNNHLQGNAVASETLGLYYNDELVFAMSFAPTRYRSDQSTEIIRAASKVYHSVPGGFSKLIKHYCRGKTGTLVSYANRRWSQGNVYRSAGFTQTDKTKPCYFYWDGKKNLYHRSHFMKHTLQNKLATFDPNLTEAENMYMNKYRRFWDSGNYTFVLNF